MCPATQLGSAKAVDALWEEARNLDQTHVEIENKRINKKIKKENEQRNKNHTNQQLKDKNWKQTTIKTSICIELYLQQRHVELAADGASSRIEDVGQLDVELRRASGALLSVVKIRKMIVVERKMMVLKDDNGSE